MRSKLLMAVSIIVISVFLMATLAACGGGGSSSNTNTTSNTNAGPAGTQEAVEEPAKPSNSGGPGQAISLTGDAKAGEQVYIDNCKECHGDQGKGGVANPGSDDQSVPPLNPIDETMKSSDPKAFATNIDLFIEHGSTPEGENPAKIMQPLGDQGKLTPQQIADVIAYVISLNP